jgi:hypothetical protein
MNGTPDLIKHVKKKYIENVQKRPDLVHTTYYRIAIKALDLKEKTLRPPEVKPIDSNDDGIDLPTGKWYPPEMAIAYGTPETRFGFREQSPIDEIRPFPKGSLGDSLSVWYVKNQLAMAAADGWASFFTGP